MTRCMHLPRRLLLFFFIALLFFIVCLTPQFCMSSPKKELLIGIEPEHNIFDQMRKYRALSRYLSDAIGIEVKLTIMSRYGEVVKRFKSLHLDGAVLSPFTSELAIRELELKPVASLVKEAGGVSSRGIVFVRKDSGITKVSDMLGKTVVFVDPATAEGYIFARAFFRGQGVNDLETYFGRYYFSGSHASAVYAVLDGRAEIGAAKDTVYAQLIGKDPSIEKELHVITQSPPVPEVTLCVQRDLDPQLFEKIRAALFEMDQTVAGHRVLKTLEAKRFTPTNSGDFAIVSKSLDEAGLNKQEQTDTQ